MKIVVAGPQFPDSFARNIAVTLELMGHQVISTQGLRARHHGNRLASVFWRYLPKAYPDLEKALFRRVVQTVAAAQPDLVLVTFGSMPPEVVSGLRESCGSKIACWYTDALPNLYRHYLLASDFDFIFLKEPFLVRILRDKLGRNACYLPECCNPIWHRRCDLSADGRREYSCEVAAEGTLHYYRASMLEIFDRYDLKIWGRNCPAWLNSPVKKHYTHHFIAEGEKARVLQSAKVVVNTMHCSEIEGVNCTLFEAAGCGAFQIADWKPALPGLFEPEREIVTFRTRRELKDKVDYYLAHPEERQRIAAQACARAHRDHTYEKRLQQMIEMMGFLSEAKEPSAEPAVAETR